MKAMRSGRGIASLLAALALTSTASAQVVVSTSRGVVSAHDGRIQLENGWNVAGVALPSAATVSDTQVAILDALHDEVTIVELDTGHARTIETAATPIDARFLDGALHILARDAHVLQTPHGDITLAPDPAFLDQSGDRLYILSRTAGVLQEIDGGRISRRLDVPPFASELEISGSTAYLTYPREARIRTIDLETMKPSGEIAVGAVPVDLAFVGGGSALTARLLAVADPSAKRVWIVESTQSLGKAIARGFLRGLLGLGLIGNRSSEFPTGVDRVEAGASGWIAYDSSSGTLYRFDRKVSQRLASAVPPSGFALTPDGVAWWDGTSVAQSALE